MIHNNRKNQKKQSGITLVALVVTIVILIILATITINIVFDDGGLIDIVKGTKDDAEDLVQSEDKKMNDLLQEYANIMGENVEIPDPEPEADKTPPIVTVTAGGTTTNSITVNVQSTDNESGMKENPTYTYYIKKSSEADSSYQAKATDVTNANYTFAGLQQETSYDIKVEVNGDKAGNKGTGTLTGQTTKKVPGGETGVEEGAITFGTTTWSGGKANITISTNTGMQIQYQVDSTSGSWTNISNGGTVGSLQHGQTVYARLTDGTNYGDYASASIVDGTAPTVSSITTGAITETSIQVTVSASDGQSGLATSNTYKYYLNGTLKSTQTSNTYSFTGLTAETSYTINVEAYDKAGNMGEKSTTAKTTKKIAANINELVAGDYVTYPSPSGDLACRVLYDSSSGYGVQLITSDTVTDSYTLGSSYFATAKNSYNNAISTLNSAVSSYNNSTYSTVRCVGSVPNNSSQDNARYFTSSYSYMSSYNGQFKEGDTNYETDFDKMGTLGIRNIGKYYWLASRNVTSRSSYSFFSTRSVSSSGSLTVGNLCSVYSDGGAYPASSLSGLRPVFTLKSGIKVTGGNGTSSSPYTLGV